MAKSGKSSRLVPALAVVLLLLLGAAAVLLFLQARSGSSASVELAGHVALAQSITLRARDAVGGNSEAFDDLRRRQSMTADAGVVAELANDNDRDAVRRSWSRMQVALKNVLAGEEAVQSSHDVSVAVDTAMPGLLTAMANLAGSLSPADLDKATPTIERFDLHSRSVAQDLDMLAKGVGNREALLRRVDESDTFFNQVLRGFAGDDTSLGLPVVGADNAQLAELAGLYAGIGDEIRNGVDASDASAEARRATDSLATDAATLHGAASRAEPDSRPLWLSWWVPLAPLGGAALVGLGMMFGARRNAGDMTELAEATEQNETNQQAILRLLDEMGSLADGDLTVEATVSEDITGAIADSINYAIEALRDLVSTIDGAASEVEMTAQQTDAMANHLAKSSENQSRQVFAATESIANMADSIEEVSGNAERSSDVARHSVEIAHKGGEAVRRTIDGMNTIRETIQDTSKRIKRLGESSQEIGNIVELINDIAEQTNILALNASIQASMAGEAGRGFAVVADEVQRLSERCTNATKQIEVLVKTIQSDTNEAVVSMERSTTDVVSGALLAENAGAALDEIEKVSNQIASLVQNISGTARQQATAAADITRNMGVLQEISAQTAENTSAASRSIKKLAEMSSELRRSVAGFTLPSRDKEAPPAEPDEMLEQAAALDDAGDILAQVGND